MTTKRIGKYACLELERRYLVRELPADLAGESDCWQITDRYIQDTHLRLRRMEWPQSGEVVFKLGQKYRGASQHEGETTITNMYLSTGEYQRLSALPAREIVKKRYRYEQNGRAYGIDVFEGGLTGLILAEIECETQPEYEQMEIPAFASRDVTGELFFTGGNLAGLTKEAFGAGLARWRGDSDFGQTLPNQLTAPDRSL